MTLDALNQLSDDEARAALARCCGSRAWVARMLAQRPFADLDALLTAAEAAATGLARADWLEAFAHHPRIGERGAAVARHGATAGWASEEQRGAAQMPEQMRSAMEAGNRAYEARFGYGFIVCATGRSAAEMLAILTARLDHDPGVELEVAAREQRAITRLRLEKLLREE